jgi:hypothetical protein
MGKSAAIVPIVLFFKLRTSSRTLKYATRSPRKATGLCKYIEYFPLERLITGGKATERVDCNAEWFDPESRKNVISYARKSVNTT